MEFLKDILGEDLYAQLSDKLKDSKIKLADLSQGGYVGVEKFKALETERDGLKTQLTAASAQIKAIEGMDIESVKKAASDWENKAKKAQADADAEIANIKFQYALDGELAKSKAKDPVLVKALLKMDALKYTDDGVLGLKEQLEPLSKSHAYLFDTGEQPPAPIAPMNPAPGAGGGGIPQENKTMNDLIRGKI